jgi:esterase/lipase superfamily enzyme
MLSHSLGNLVAVEALRQMAIRDHGLSRKIKDKCRTRRQMS